MDTLIKKLKLNKKCTKCKFKCEAIHFKQNFKNWTSGNKCIDKFIQNTQLSAHDDAQKASEWIPYDRFYNVNYIQKRKVYKANWIDGCVNSWNNKGQYWVRNNGDVIVILESLADPKNATLEFVNQVYQFMSI
jgi:hypothetical protein